MKSDREAVNSLARRIQNASQRNGQPITHRDAKKLVIRNLNKANNKKST